MGYLANLIISGLGAVFSYLIKKFAPGLIKRFGIRSVKTGIQTSISVIVMGMYLSFWIAFAVFLNETYIRFTEFMTLLSNPAASGSSDSSGIVDCVMYLLNVSGFVSGFNSALSFFLIIIVFLFLRVAYINALEAMKVISEEINKILKLI